MYKAKNGFILWDDITPSGWKITKAPDIIKALLEFPTFQTVATPFIWESIQYAIEDRKQYENITEFAEFIAKNYI